MYVSTVLLLTVVVTSVQGFFFLLEKKHVFYCAKVCPLYCPDLSSRMETEDKRVRRRAPSPPYEYIDEDDASFEDIPSYIDADEFEKFPVHYYRPIYVHHKKTTTTTTTTTTEKVDTAEPTLICRVCKKDCRYYYK